MVIQNLLDSLPDSTVLLSDGRQQLDRAALAAGLKRIRAALKGRAMPAAPVGILADNSPEWLMIDLATQELGLTLVPLPLFFTPQQWLHVIAQSGIGGLFCADPAQGAALGFGAARDCGGPLALCEAREAPPAAALDLRRHLCLLSFAVLLENIAGPYTALLSGATTICPPLAETGMRGASGFDAAPWCAT